MKNRTLHFPDERTTPVVNIGNPAGLAALARGDTANAMLAMTPGGIEAQEKRGQLTEAIRQTLPKKLGDSFMQKESARVPWEKLGFVFGEAADDLFVSVTFPKGWKKEPTDHSMWSDILDDKGRKRGAIFYKAAFYDRAAHAHLNCRFGICQTYPKRGSSEKVSVHVEDKCKLVAFSIDGLEPEDWSGSREAAMLNSDAIDAAKAKVLAWMKQHYPDHDNVLAYWDV